MGETFAILAAAVWAVAVILFKRSGETTPAFSLNLFRVGVSTTLFLLVAAATGARGSEGLTLGDYAVLCASGLLGVAVSDTFFHMSLNRVGAGISAILDCLYSPSVLVLAYFLLGEKIGVAQLAGMLLVLAAIALTSRLTPHTGVSTGDLWVGLTCGVLAMITLALGIVIVKPTLERTSVLWATTVRQAASLAVMLPMALALPSRRDILRVFRPSRSWRYSLPATLLGSFVAVLFWIAGMKHTEATTAAILNQTNTIFIIVLAAVFLGETFTVRKALATVLALGGIVLVVLG
jgi:drug/metabolite transporter (DMT)-like permease